MNQKEFSQFVSYLHKEYQVFAPQEEGNQVIIKELPKNKKTTLTNRLPFYSWKRFFVPEKEIMFGYADSKLTEPPLSSPPCQGGEGGEVALLGVNILDLRAILLYDLVFSAKGGSAMGGTDDPYYQRRRKNIFVIGYGPEIELLDGTIRKIEEGDLNHLPFDIFLFNKDNDFIVFTQTEKGAKILDEIKYKNYTEIKFMGQKDNDFLKGKKNLRRDKLKDNHNQKIWDELGKICIECGKCTIACPTCFCFRIDDQAELSNAPYRHAELVSASYPQSDNHKIPNQVRDDKKKKNEGIRGRCWDSCFYNEFSEVAGEHKFLNNAAQRIHFWYFHKFARISDEYNMMGCVGCQRCHVVCPVGINIKEVLEEIEKT